MSDLVYKDDLTSGLTVSEIYEGAWDGREQEHVEEYEGYIVYVIRLVILNGEELVIWVRIECSSRVDYEYHVIEASIVCLIGIEGYGIFWVLIIGVKFKRSAAD